MDEKKFVSRGGLKLDHALKSFGIDVKGLTILDVGSSTGGFVDCLLQRGAEKVYSVDTAYGELAWKLRQDPRVVVIERQNILFLEPLPELVDLVTIDVTFTSLQKILPVIQQFLKPGGKTIALLKPQYEDQKLALNNHGVIPQEELQGIIKRFSFEKIIESPIKGGSGNTEYLILL